MASSVQVIGEKAEIFDDIDLLIILRLFNEEVGLNPGQYSSLRNFSIGWNECCTHYGPGVIHLELDAVAADPAAKVEFLELLSSVERILAGFGGIIPADTLKKRCRVRGVRFYDYATSTLATTIERLRTFLS